jgi:hypothetical protein
VWLSLQKAVCCWGEQGCSSPPKSSRRQVGVSGGVKKRHLDELVQTPLCEICRGVKFINRKWNLGARAGTEFHFRKVEEF